MVGAAKPGLIRSAPAGNSVDLAGRSGYGRPVSINDPPLRMSQYVYFALKSETVPASMITASLGIEPDSITVRGIRRPEPPVPASHIWSVECRQRGMRVDDQAARVLARIRPVAEPIRALTADGSVWAVLQVVRFFMDDDGEQEDEHQPVVTDDGRVLHRLPGQHQLLGWHLAIEDLVFLASIPAAVDVDEYG